MDYSFDVDIASKYGVDEAIFIQNLYFWIEKNEANGRHFYNGRYWTYNSAKALAALFPFWTAGKINKLTAKMEMPRLPKIPRAGCICAVKADAGKRIFARRLSGG